MSLETAIILNVEDTEAARYTKHRTLRHAGFEVVDAHNGAEALRCMENLRPALALLDVHLPDMSGLEVCKQIKQRWPSTMVLQTSATMISSRDRTQGLEGGADAYLIQPTEPQELVAAVRALLRLHAAEAATRTLNATLEARVEERTRELRRANVQLLEQIAQRERAEYALIQSQKLETVGQLSDVMVHDFKNILSGVAAQVRGARGQVEGQPVQPLLDDALLAAERGQRLTERFLAFSRPGEMLASAVDVRALLLQLNEWLQQTAGHGNPVTLALPEHPVLAQTDSPQLELALLNLVMNARDAMPDGGRITIAATQRQLLAADAELAPGRYTVVSVQDTGSGMPPEVAARAFEPFFTTKLPSAGTGLGLLQVSNLCRFSQGSARLQSEPGVGTTVALWLAAA
ncbi:MAG TPA: response regulator [Ideonella sp.]|uniref:response regulator n=1 Tax=Ideonella sp. TaxID=1929293 RepID=UPI002C3B3D2D|nr:response regulator [Ideonella sp.]HSI49837.1 response regulator [Ideonella sp.]